MTSVLIIGGGISGLSAGIYARRNGFETRIFEHHRLPGGQCTAWKRKGYTVDWCIHWLMDAAEDGEMRRLYDEVGALDGNRLITLDRYTRFIDEASGRSLDILADVDETERQLLDMSPSDEKPIRAFCKEIRSLREARVPIPTLRELSGLRDGISAAWTARGLLPVYARHRSTSVAQWCSRNLQDPLLKEAISNLFLPSMPMVFLLTVLGELAGRRLAVVEGGSQRFADAVARRYESLGGRIQYGARVERIIVEGGKALGVVLADGTQERGDIVISAADGHSTLFEMLDERWLTDDFRRLYSDQPLFPPLVMVTYGTRKRWELPWSSASLRLASPIEVAGEAVDELGIRHFPYDPTMAPEGCSPVQVLLNTSWESWERLARDRSAYDAEKERISKEILDRLEAWYPGIGASVEMTDVATPWTNWRYTRVWKAAWEGFLPTSENALLEIPRTLPGLEGFYLCGQWVVPGGGLPPAIYTARQAIQLICHQRRLPFQPLG